MDSEKQTHSAQSEPGGVTETLQPFFLVKYYVVSHRAEEKKGSISSAGKEKIKFGTPMSPRAISENKVPIGIPRCPQGTGARPRGCHVCRRPRPFYKMGRTVHTVGLLHPRIPNHRSEILFPIGSWLNLRMQNPGIWKATCIFIF